MRRWCLGVMLVAAACGIVLEGQSRPTLFGIGPSADTFFDDALLHDIRVDINAADWQSLRDRPLERTFYVCHLRWRNQTLANIGIRSRGTGSQSTTKPGLLVELGQYVTDQRFLGLK